MCHIWSGYKNNVWCKVKLHVVDRQAACCNQRNQIQHKVDMRNYIGAGNQGWLVHVMDASQQQGRI